MNDLPRLHLVASPWVADLLTHLWQSTVVGLAILLLLLLGRRLSARTRRTLGWIAVAKFAVPAAWLGALARGIGGTTPARMLPDAGAVPAGQSANALVAELPVSVWAPPAWLWPWLGGVWAAVAVGLLAHWFIRGVRVRRGLLAQARPVDEALMREVAAAAARAGLRATPRAVEVERDHGPGALGIISPVLILPRGLMEGLAPAERAAILIHECVHVRRRDNFWSAVRAAFVGALWFNPIAWLLSRALAIETEKSCDERVLEITGDADNYASGIVASVRHTLGVLRPGFAAATTPPVVARLTHILAYPAKPDRPALRWTAIAAALALVALCGRAGSVAATAERPVRVAQAARVTPSAAAPAPAKPAYKIGKITLRFVSPATIGEAEVRAAMQLREGGEFNETTLDRDVRAIYRLGAFKTVEVKHQPVDGATFDLVVELTPKPTVGAFGAPGTEPARSNSLSGTLTLSSDAARSSGVTFELPMRPALLETRVPGATPAGDAELRAAQAQLAAESAELKRMREEREAAVARQRLEQEERTRRAAFAREQRAVMVPGGAPPTESELATARQKLADANARAAQLRAERDAALARERAANPALLAFDGPVFELKDLDRRPVPQFQARPQYPFEMRRSGIEGEVVVDFIIDTDGRVQLAHAIRSSRQEFEAAAVLAVSRWRFLPGRKEGKSVPTHLQMPVVFTLNKN